jgi:hypothetical protein
MSRRKPAAAITTTTGHKAELIKTMQGLAHRHDLWRVFSDFVEMAAVSIANACDTFNRDRDAREARYMEMIKAYTREELAEFPKMLGQLTMALECGMDDVLGEVFMELDLGSKWHGQFFTPYELCQMMAAINIGPDNVKAEIERKGFITVNEPACGGGAMLLAMAEELQRAGVNYQKHMHCTAQDLDLKAVHMAYVQMSLLHIPAIVIHGNTLTLEERSHWCTPAHIMGGWAWKLRRPQAPANDNAPTPEPVPQPAELAPPPPPAQWQQAGLF